MFTFVIIAKIKLKNLVYISILLISSLLLPKAIKAQLKGNVFGFEFYGDSVLFNTERVNVSNKTVGIDHESISAFYNQINTPENIQIVSQLLAYKTNKNLNDWIYYQLVRKTANSLCAKTSNYNGYSVFKWYLLNKSGYDAKLVTGNKSLLLYVKSDENVYDIPFFMQKGNQYVCLNYHDFGKINFEKEHLKPVNINIAEGVNSFSYKVTQLPNFAANTYSEKQISFEYKQKTYQFNVKLNNQVQQIFKNYPVVDFESYFNIPLSNETYSSLIPFLKENIKNINQKEGIDYLMNFTRYAFLYENDQTNFGKEKRLSPEQTLLFEHSDCDDRAALFFYLVKEIYNLPMIAVLYPTHITIAVQFDKPEGNPIVHNGRNYSICDPTPQSENLLIGQISSELSKAPFQVVYEYLPRNK
jgi:hypothetical protein